MQEKFGYLESKYDSCFQVDSASRVGSESDHVPEGMTAIKELLVKKI